MFFFIKWSFIEILFVPFSAAQSIKKKTSFDRNSQFMKEVCWKIYPRYDYFCWQLHLVGWNAKLVPLSTDLAARNNWAKFWQLEFSIINNASLFRQGRHRYDTHRFHNIVIANPSCRPFPVSTSVACKLYQEFDSNIEARDFTDVCLFLVE